MFNKVDPTQGIIITDQAIAYFEDLLQNEPKNTNIRITVTSPGTQYADVKVAFCLSGTEALDDFAIQLSKFVIFVEEKALEFLTDATIEFLADDPDQQLSIKAPNLKICSNDTRTLAEKITCVIENEINPILASHGGMIALDSLIDNDTIALLKFGGGCKGCGVADLTFAQLVETMLRQHFPQLKEIRNATEHQLNIY